jgi:hypothetical protein
MSSAAILGVSDAAPAQTRSPQDGIYTDAQANRGASGYSEMCAVCHNTDLSGTELAPPLTRAALTGKWGSRSLGDLFEYMQTFMPLNSPGGVTRQRNAEILAFILKQAQFPAGREDLSSKYELLTEIRLIGGDRR